MQEEENIKNYRNISREKLLSTLEESEHNFKNISQNGLEKIVEMQNVSQMNLSKSEKCGIYCKMN